MKPLNEQPLMAKDLLQRRLTRMVMPKGSAFSGGFRRVATIPDVAKWFGCTGPLIRHMQLGIMPINDEWQVKLSQFFFLFDGGHIQIIVDLKNRQKHWERAVPETPPCKRPMPRIDFATTKLRFD